MTNWYTISMNYTLYNLQKQNGGKTKIFIKSLHRKLTIDSNEKTEMNWISSACSTNDTCRCVVLQFTSTNTNAIKKHEVLYIKLVQRRTGHRFYAAIVKDITRCDWTFDNMFLDKMNNTITNEKRGELWYSWRVERFCSSSRSCRVTRFKFGDNAYYVISLEREQDCISLRQAEHIRGHLLHRYSVHIDQLVIATVNLSTRNPWFGWFLVI
jgi:hypothetical protein